MKKTALGLGVLAIYGVYSIGVRHQHPTIALPSSLVSTPKANNKSASSTIGYSNSPSSTSSSLSPKSTSNAGLYHDGTYIGKVENVYYGNVQVSVKISNGRIADVQFLQYPNTHSTSVYINQQVMPYLKKEALKSQHSNVQIITGATFTSEGFIQSLKSALSKA
jgi:uncharacterized protein with FMN-binding domain